MNEDFRICFVGDSFVNGTGDDTALGWVGRVSAEAQARGVRLTSYNLGVRRDTSQDVLARWEAECRRRLPPDCDGRIVLSFGVNDTVVETGHQRVPLEASCEALRQIVRAAGGYSLLFVGPPPVADDEHNERIRRLASTLLDEAAALEIPHIDLFTPLVTNDAYRAEAARGDGAHPTATGYAQIAACVRMSPAWWFG